MQLKNQNINIIIIKFKQIMTILILFSIINIIENQVSFSQNSSTKDTIQVNKDSLIIENKSTIKIEIQDPIIDNGFEPFLEFNTRSSNTTPMTDDFDTDIEFDTQKNIVNLYELPAIDVKSASLMINMLSDSIFSELDIFLDSLNNLYEINQNQNVIISDVLNSKVKSNKISNKTNNEKFNPKLIYRVRNQSRFGDIRGIEEDKFAGNDLDLFQRMIYKDDSFYGIIQTKKSVGEANVNEFMSGSLAYNDGKVKLIVGDFVPSVGFGSVFWTAFAPTKGSDVISPTMRLSKGIEPNKSTINFNIFRGIYGEYNFDLTPSSSNSISRLLDKSNLKLRLWYANNDKSATINENNEVTGIAISPKFRTETEIAKRNNLSEKNHTINLEYQTDKNVYGLLYTSFQYDKTINPNSDFIFDTNNVRLLSYYNLINFDNFAFANEIVIDPQMNYSIKLSTQNNLGKLIWSNQFRYSNPNIRSMYGYNFGELGEIPNQMSFYNAFEYKYDKKLRFYQYSEIYNSIDKYSNLTSIQKGIDIFLETEYLIANNTKLINRLKYENKIEAANLTGFNQRVSYDRSRYELRLELQTLLDKETRLRVRYESNYITFSDYFRSESGNLAYIELQHNLIDDFKIFARYSVFNTDSFNSAIWQYEYAMVGYTTTTSLYGKGSRFFITGVYDINSHITMNLRYSSTLFNFRENIGTGSLEINDNNDSKLLLQFDIKY